MYWVACQGSAHSKDSQDDHCPVCLPYWGKYPVCGKCGAKMCQGKKFYTCPNKCKGERTAQ